MALEIYNYTEGHRFIRDLWLEKKKKNSSFSLRAWARHLGFKSHAPLNLMLTGKRGIPKRYVPQLISGFGLSPREGLYFEALLDFDRSNDPAKKEFFLERLRELSPKPLVRIHEVEHFTILRDPLHTFLLEMTDLKGFRNDTAWIKAHLRIPATSLEIAAALERLIAMGLLREATDGTLSKTHQHLGSRPDMADKAVQEYHRRVLALAAEQISLQPVEDREFNSYSLNIKKSELPLAKTMIRAFVKEFMANVEAKPGSGEESYQLSVQFFGITAGSGGSGTKTKKGRKQNGDGGESL